jgi:glycosyltransferase involved in cell wall biosynthesis
VLLDGKTILQIIPTLHAGGVELSSVHAAEAIVANGGNALMASEPGRMVEDFEALGGTWLPFPAATKNPVSIALNVKRLVRLAQDHKADLLHVRSRAPAWSAYYAARQLGLPLVTSFHSIYGLTVPLKKHYNKIMVRGDTVIANSHYTAAHIETHYPESKGRIRVIHSGTDVEAYDPAKMPRARVDALANKIGLDPKAQIVLLPGRITERKAQLLLVQAAAILKSRHKRKIQYVMMGEARDKENYLTSVLDLIATENLQGICVLAPHSLDMPAAMAMADLVVVPSIRPEAFGRTVAEAAAMERPVISSDLGAPKEIILAPPDHDEEHLTGWRVEPGNVASLADSIGHALSLSAAERRKIGKRGRRRVCENFSLARCNEATIDVYNRLLNVNR